MMYTVKRIDEDLNFGCEERPDDAPVMAIVTLVDSSGKEVTVKAEDARLYERFPPAGAIGFFYFLNNLK